MTHFKHLFLQGLLAILPITITLSILYWLGSTAESTLGYLLNLFLPEGWYRPGLGLLAGFFVIIAVGVVLNAFVFKKIARLTHQLFEQIPYVKTLYNSIQDIAKFTLTPKENIQRQKVVSVTLDNDIKVIGFITRESIKLGADGQDLVAVYVPMSYQIGGFTLMLPEYRLEKLDMNVQDAMRMVLTAGIKND